MKSKVDKYDVLKGQTIRSLKKLPNFVYRIAMIKILKRKLNKLATDGLNNPDTVLKYRDTEEKYDLQMAHFTIDAAGILKTTAHSVYETAKDIEAMDVKSLEAFLTSKNITLSSFAFNFQNQLQDALYYLALYAILEKNGIPAEIQNPKGIFQIISLFNKDFQANTTMNDADLALLEKLANPNFQIKDLTTKESEFLASYHDKYMQEIIDCFVTTAAVPSQKVLKNAYKIYQKN